MTYNYKNNQDYPEFKKAFDILMKLEGEVYVNNPNDPGGETKYGISKRAFPEVEIKMLTKDSAEELYYFNYWWPMCCDLLVYPDSLLLFDAAVHHGVARVKRWAKLISSWKELIPLRRKFFATIIRNNPKLKVFEKGWENRLQILQKEVDNYAVKE